jgi:hypothetical protein
LELLRFVRIKFYARRSSATKSSGYHGREPVGAIGDGPQAIHQPLKNSFLLIVVAVTNAHSSGVSRNLGRQKQKTQSRRRQLCMFHLSGFQFLFPVEQ